MNKKWLPWLVLIIMALAIVGIRQCNDKPVEKRTTKNQDNQNRNRGFDRRTSYLEYTRHAKCRMDCRHITQSEVEEIMKEGVINYRKSEVKQTPCPVYALEGNTSDNQRVRIVFAQCDHKTKVVTVIDLDREWQCDCPGDDRTLMISPDKKKNP